MQAKGKPRHHVPCAPAIDATNRIPSERQLTLTSRTVLVADDDSAIRTVLTQALTRAGFSVRATGMASALWRWVSEGEGDVVVSDVVLPDENAFDVLPRIRKLRPTLPVIMMSAQNTIMTAIRSAELGALTTCPSRLTSTCSCKP